MFEDPETARVLAISPHLNDAVLSVGAGLAQAALDGAKVIVHTVFAGSAPPPYSAAAERMHAVWGLSPHEDATLRRREEDIAALDHLGVTYRHGRFLDSIYRKRPDGQWLASPVAGGAKLAVQERSSDSDGELVAEIKEDLESVIEEFGPTLIVTCAAILDHPDNQVARDAALFAAHEKNIPTRLWEDLPYAVTRPGPVELPPGFHRGPAVFSPATDGTRTRKFQAVECYSSQLGMLNGRAKNMFERLTEHARNNSPDGGYGETTWPVVRDEVNS
ncbi:PIG-L deacetylase family protein [Amycolatopsis umgeniensis]|uniref:LmbE family N-acetylglucosaminyl deacetylase n=1 Tax=Amycolatopsis umgeniensis TaxID=336628 RepID=A0A841BAN4_9PSEU|nr:PIG-L family deacetylase [Amycolatopsis umgeniensis]MBB5855632.1 LmbE family N-acetylglucosaminyl deacetylase [Amycolatopsis umgeniensis]